MEKAPSIIAWAKRIAWIAIFVMVIGGEFFVYRRCTSGRNFRFDIAKQAFMVDYGDVCGLGLFIEGETSDDFYHIENHAAPSGGYLYDENHPTEFYLNEVPSCYDITDLYDDTLKVSKLPLLPNATYRVMRSRGCQVSQVIYIKTDKTGRVVPAERDE